MFRLRLILFLSSLLISPFAMAGDKENCLAAGFDDYISKPVNKDALIRTLQKFV